MAKKSSLESTKKQKKSKKNRGKLGVQNSAVRKNNVEKENPFESIWSRRKFNILGKKRKEDERRRIGLSRSLAIQKRQKTLLKEYEQSTKSSVFVDKRIGEQNEVLGEFDKAILRSQHEIKLKLKKKAKFNLSDGEEDDLEINNAFFPERDDYEDEETYDEDGGDQSFGSEKKLDISGQPGPYEAEDGPQSMSMQENRIKSKKEVMEDIISKSKYFKAQKAKDKEENEQFIEQLDSDFKSLVQSEALLSLTNPNQMVAFRNLANESTTNDIAKNSGTNTRHNKVSYPQEAPDPYAKLFDEMALEMRARPSNRTKTPEERAQEEKEHLEHLEEERQKRMVASDDNSDEDACTSDDDKSAERPAHISGDDLGDSFSHDVNSNSKVVWIDDILKKGTTDLESEDGMSSAESENTEEEGSDDDHDDDDDDDDDDEEEEDVDDDDMPQSLKDWEQSDDENIDTILKDEESEDEEEQKEEDANAAHPKKSSKSRGKQKDSSGPRESKPNFKEHQGELPYTIEAPKNFEELCALLENRTDDEVLEAIRRIRAFNSITVSVENRKKMQVFYGVLLQYFAVLGNRKPLNFKLLNMLVKPLIEMSSETPYFAAICARQRLLHARRRLCEDSKQSGKNCWPSLKVLFLLRLWCMIFPCSDFRHVVMTPATLLMSEYLMRCNIVCGRDIAIGSFLCSMLLSVSRQSRKFCPEAITFIETMLMAALNNKLECQDSQLSRLMVVKALKPLLRIEGHVEEVESLDFLTIMDLPDDSHYFSSDIFRASVLFAIIATLRGFVDVYVEFKSFPEIFSSVSKLLRELAEQDHLPETLKAQIQDVAHLIDKKSQETCSLRQPLRLRKQKIIKTVAPKFEENFMKGRDYDPDRERAERKKLKKRMKQEAKGAARELRKDNYFLLEVKQKERDRAAEERAEKYGKDRAFLQEQEHAFKSGQLGKRSGKRRR